MKRTILKSSTVDSLSTEAFLIGSDHGGEDNKYLKSGSQKDAGRLLSSTNQKNGKFFSTATKSKIGMRHMDLLKADSRRRQANFLRENPTFRIKNIHRKLTDVNNPALKKLAENSLYFKSNTQRRNLKNTVKKDEEID